MQRRGFLKSVLAGPAAGLTQAGGAAGESYLYLGRTSGYRPHRIIEPGRKITRIETFTSKSISIVRIETADGAEGWGQISTYDADISATVLHRKIARHFLGRDPAAIDEIADRAVEANYKYPWSYVCRALAGADTAVWDLYGRIRKEPVVALLGGKHQSHGAYGSSMSRTIQPEQEAARLKKLKEEKGFQAFKVRLGRVNGHNRDQWPGRTEELIPAVRKAVGDEVKLLADANSCYTPDKAVEIGRLLEDHGYYQYEEPCPYWELEWTAEVARKLEIPVSGGEQDNDLAQWRRMIRMRAVDVVQPDVCYLGGLTRTLRVAQMAQEAGLPCVPHSANLSLVTVFSLHLLGAIPNAAPYVEFSIETEAGINQEARRLYSPRLVVKDGRVAIPSGPGWGVKIRQEWLAEAEHQESHI